MTFMKSRSGTGDEHSKYERENSAADNQRQENSEDRLARGGFVGAGKTDTSQER